MQPGWPFGYGERGMAALVNEDRLRRILTRMLDEKEFLSPYGIRALSRYHEEHPYVVNVEGHEYRVNYLPAESDTGMFGGNSNWRGPIWMPVNALLTGSEFSHRQNTLTQAPMGAIEMHLSYDVKPRLWVSVDGNYWYGGETTVNNVLKIGTLQSNSRIGGTLSIPLSKHQSVKFSYSDGELARIGGTFQTVSLAWQYSWLRRPN
jgi:hypothetical protein